MIVVPGDEIRVTGENFTGDPLLDLVVLDGSTYATVTFASPTELVATVPLTAQSGPVTVATPAGSDRTSDALVVLPQGFDPARVTGVARIEDGDSFGFDNDQPNRTEVFLFDAEAGQVFTVGPKHGTVICRASVSLRGPGGQALGARGSQPCFGRGQVRVMSSGTHAVIATSIREGEVTFELELSISTPDAVPYEHPSEWATIELLEAQPHNKPLVAVGGPFDGDGLYPVDLVSSRVGSRSRRSIWWSTTSFPSC